MIKIAYLSDRSPAFNHETPDFAGWQPYRAVFIFFAQQLGSGTRAPDDLSTFIRFEFKVMDHRAGWHIAQRHVIAGFYLCAFPGYYSIAHAYTQRAKYIAFFAIGIKYQRYA
jgi:hypothetical protein